jgi:hypothetical protein
MKVQNKLFIVVLAAITSLSVNALEKASEARLDEIAQKGVQIMPFNLDQTIHVFSKKADGGLQQQAQYLLILSCDRDHFLRKYSARILVFCFLDSTWRI